MVKVVFLKIVRSLTVEIRQMKWQLDIYKKLSSRESETGVWVSFLIEHKLLQFVLVYSVRSLITFG